MKQKQNKSIFMAIFLDCQRFFITTDRDALERHIDMRRKNGVRVVWQYTLKYPTYNIDYFYQKIICLTFNGCDLETFKIGHWYNGNYTGSYGIDLDLELFLEHMNNLIEQDKKLDQQEDTTHHTPDDECVMSGGSNAIK